MTTRTALFKIHLSVSQELDRKLQSISASIEAVCRKTLQEVNRDSGAKSPTLKIFVKDCMSYKNSVDYG